MEFTKDNWFEICQTLPEKWEKIVVCSIVHASTLHAFNYYQSFDFIVYTVSVPGFWKWSQLTECKSASVSRENGPDFKKKSGCLNRLKTSNELMLPDICCSDRL